MKKLYLFFSLTLVFGCNNTKQENNNKINLESKNVDTLKKEKEVYYFTSCDTLKLNKDLKILKQKEDLITFNEKNFLLCSPKGQIIDSIPFNTKLRSYEMISSSSGNWLKVFYKNKYGFINKPKDIISIDNRGNLLLIKRKSKQIEIKSFNEKTPNKIVDTYNFPFSTVKSRIYDFFYNGLDKTNIVIKYQGVSRRDGTENLINIRPNGEINEIIDAKYENDWEYSKWEHFYYPLKFGNGKVLLVLNADYENIFNVNTTELNIFKYPNDINTPINQLIIKIKGNDAPELDENGKIVTDDGTEEGMPILEVIEIDTTYYKWNGEKLLKIK